MSDSDSDAPLEVTTTAEKVFLRKQRKGRKEGKRVLKDDEKTELRKTVKKKQLVKEDKKKRKEERAKGEAADSIPGGEGNSHGNYATKNAEGKDPKQKKQKKRSLSGSTAAEGAVESNPQKESNPRTNESATGETAATNTTPAPQLPNKISRVVLKNIPKYMTEGRLRETFSEYGLVTDVKILKKDGQPRQVAFLGFKTPEAAETCVKKANRTYLDTQKLIVELALPTKAAEIARPWSKYSQGSSLHQKLNPHLYEDAKKGKGDETVAGKKRTRSEDAVGPSDSKQKVIDELLNLGSAKRSKLADGKLTADAEKERKELLKKSESEKQQQEEQEQRKKEEEDADLKTRNADAEKSAAFDGGLDDLAYLKKGAVANIDDIDSDEDYEMEVEKENIDDSAKDGNAENASTAASVDTGIDSRNADKDTEEDDASQAEASQAESSVADSSPAQSSSKLELDADPLGTDLAAETGRLFVRNIPYTCTEDELEEHFKQLGGDVSSVKICIDEDTQKSRGFAYVSFVFPDQALRALTELEGSCFQGRLIKICGAKSEDESAQALERAALFDESGAAFGTRTSSYKKLQKEKLKNQNQAQREQSWNLLYVSANQATDAVAARLGIKKSDLLNRDDSNLAVTVALGETFIIQETKTWLEREGIRVDAFNCRGKSLLTAQTGGQADGDDYGGSKANNSSQQQQKNSNVYTRSKDTLIVKHLPPDRVDEAELKERLGRYGQIKRFCLAPSKTVAVIQFAEAKHCQRVFLKEAGSRYKHVPLMLEYAPQGVFEKDVASSGNPPSTKKPIVTTADPPTSDDVSKFGGDSGKHDDADAPHDLPAVAGATIFIKNLNFNTQDGVLQQFFKLEDGFRSVQIMKKKNTKGASQSLGYGFAEFDSKEKAEAVVKKRQGWTVDGHVLNLEISNRNARNKQKEKDVILKGKDGKNLPPLSNKLCVRNLAFETNKTELLQLFSAYGKITSLRLPKKQIGHTAQAGTFRGFAFVDYLTKSEAVAAFEALQHTHFYGRKLVIEPAEKEALSVDEVRMLTENRENKVSEAEKRRKEVVAEGSGGNGTGGGSFKGGVVGNGKSGKGGKRRGGGKGSGKGRGQGGKGKGGGKGGKGGGKRGK